MRSKALPPARAQGHIVPFLEAAALFAALCIFARTAALMLAAAITAPLPMAETLFWLGRQSAQEQPASSVQVEAAPDSTPEAAASSLPQAVQALTGNIEDYLVPLLGEGARPADAGTVIEKNYPQGSGEKYIPCGAGSIKNNTRQTAADIAAEIENPLPFAIECIIEAAVRIGAYLDSPERNLCTGINISITIRTDKRVHVVRQLFSLSHARQDTHQTRPNQKQSLFTQSTSHIYSYCACTSPTAT